MTPQDDRPRCGDAGGTTKRGTPCLMFLELSETNGLCLQHDPERTAQADAMRKAGSAKMRSEWRRLQAGEETPVQIPPAPKTLRDAVKLSSWITRATLDRTIDVRVSSAATRALRQFQMSVEKRALEQRIEELQERLSRAERGGEA